MPEKMTPDNPEFFQGPKEVVKKRIEEWLAAVGQKHKAAEEGIYKEWEQTKYERIVVEPVEWLNSDEYAGHTGKRCYEKIKEDFYYVMTMDPRPMILILKGSIGWGKTFFSRIVMHRLLYELTCLRSPQAYYGLSADSRIVLMNMSVSKGHARKVFFQELKDMVDADPYFDTVCPRNKGNNSLIEFPSKKVSFIPGSSSELSALGENIFGGVIEEANFYPVVVGSKKIVNPEEKEFDTARKMFDSLRRRMMSRYQVYGRVPGMLVLNSSAAYPDDFLEKVCRESDPNETVVIEHAEWETKPPERYSGKKFFVFEGDAQAMPKIIKKEEVEEFKKVGPVLEVPIEYKQAFEKDIMGAMRDIAGRNVRMVDRFLPDDERIDYVFESGKGIPMPFGSRFDLGIQSDELGSAVNPQELLRRDTRKAYGRDVDPVLQYHPEAGRFAHIDLSSVSDSTGFCICHVGELREVERRIERDDKTVEIVREVVPEIYIDVVLKIIPPDRGEIEFEEIRSLIHRFSEECGMRFAKITFDLYQSRDSQQLLRKRFGDDVVSPLSVDRSPDPYLVLKETLNEKRLHSYFYAPLAMELRTVIVNPRNKKIDHPPNGSKDVADAVAGAVFSAVKEFDKSFIDDVQLGEVEEDTVEEDLEKRSIRWLLDGDLNSPKPPEENPGKKVVAEIEKMER